MARPIERTETLGEGISQAIREYCYENLAEFYRRHFSPDEISYQILSAAVAGDLVTPEAKELIETRWGEIQNA